jgi:hypothetical protein
VIFKKNLSFLSQGNYCRLFQDLEISATFFKRKFLKNPTFFKVELKRFSIQFFYGNDESLGCQVNKKWTQLKKKLIQNF